MKSTYRLILIAAFVLMPLLVQPAFAIYFEHDPDNPAEHAPMKEGQKGAKSTKAKFHSQYFQLVTVSKFAIFDFLRDYHFLIRKKSHPQDLLRPADIRPLPSVLYRPSSDLCLQSSVI